MMSKDKKDNPNFDVRLSCVETDIKWIKWLLGILVVMDSSIIFLILQNLK